MADISKINLGGTVYNIKDSVARDAIVNTLKFKGITTVAITNEGTQVPTDIYGEKATAANIRVGDLVACSMLLMHTASWQVRMRQEVQLQAMVRISIA